MSPRAYQRRRREDATAATRGRIIAAALELLTEPDGVVNFSIDAIARRADVARMTVYYQFKSKRGLIEALFDDLGARAQLSELGKAIGDPDALRGLDTFIEAFVRFWAADRVVIYRLGALAALDGEIQRALRERRGWRREGIEKIVERTNAAGNDDVIDALFMLTSFETFDTLTSSARTPADVSRIVKALARATVAGTPA